MRLKSLALGDVYTKETALRLGLEMELTHPLQR